VQVKGLALPTSLCHTHTNKFKCMRLSILSYVIAFSNFCTNIVITCCSVLYMEGIKL